MLVQRLREIQNRFGFLPDEELHALARDTGLPLYRIEEVSSFFPGFRLGRADPAEIVVRVCRDMTCHLRGSAALLDEKKGLPSLTPSLSSATGCTVAVEGVSCLGRCDRAPVVWAERHPMPEGVHAWVYAGRTLAQLEDLVRLLVTGEMPPPSDADGGYKPHTNTDRAAWDIDVYAREGWDRDYRAARQFVEFLNKAGGTISPPPRSMGGKDLDVYVQQYHPMLWELKLAGLLGMGGAGAPTFQKWLDVWREPGAEKYVVANGDESEPGTFKDRELMLRHPHLVVEGVILAGLMTGATAGHIFVRHEYHEQIESLRDEIARAESLGACGPEVFGCGRAFPVEVFESPGGYICGEQSALIEAMEDRRAQPRNRPPELTTNGLYDRPTVVNNVETLAWAPAVVLRGGKTYAAAGSRVPAEAKQLAFTGRRLFSVSGDVERPGVYEVPVGLQLRWLLEDPKYCGGVRGKLKAVATSGPSGGLLPARLPVDPKFDEKKCADAVARIRERSQPDAELMEWFLATQVRLGAKSFNLLRVPLDLNFFRNLNSVFKLPVEAMLGAGLVVYAEGTDILDQAVNFTEFYRNESCGKCVPCRVGSQKLVQIGTDLLRRRDQGVPTPDTEGLRQDVRQITKVVQLTSICGLGYVAPIPLATALAYFPEELEKKPDAAGTPPERNPTTE
jgi:NADH:ubiquinone oxidoreductase subunit F (NADH-binding)/NADH:ubiquinone oxidoreductase subunit E